MSDAIDAKPDAARSVDDWGIAVVRRANLLLQGEESETSRALGALTPWLGLPLQAWAAGLPFSLPAGRIGTMILYNVDRLAMTDQTRLLQWSDQQAARVHIVSISSVPLHLLVECGEFLEGLYYRLNTVVVEANRIAAPQGG